MDLHRDEQKSGTGLVLDDRLLRPECTCPRGHWGERDQYGRPDLAIVFYTTGFGATSRAASLLSGRFKRMFDRSLHVVDERTPYVCLRPELSPLSGFDLFPKAERVVYVSPEVYFFDDAELPDFSKLGIGLHACRLPSPYAAWYSGIFCAHRNLRVLFEVCKDHGKEWWEKLIKSAEASDMLREFAPVLSPFFPNRQKAPKRRPRVICFDGMKHVERNALLAQMVVSPRPWREVCRHYRWADLLRKAEPYPAGTRIVIDAGIAGIGDLIDTAHIVRSLREENPNADVSVYTKDAKRGFVDLYGNYGSAQHGTIRFELPPNPWHLLDATKHAATRIENWALYCGASVPRLADPLIGPEADAFASEFTEGLKHPIVALSPVSTCRTRSWPLERFEALGWLLQKAGFGVFVIDDPEGCKTRYAPFKRLYGVGAEREAAVIRQCSLLIGNDSGMAHLSASLKVPTLAICGPTSGQPVFGWYAEAQWIDGPLPCAGCYFYREKGWREECEHGCLSILEIGTAEVFGRAVRMLSKPKKQA